MQNGTGWVMKEKNPFPPSIGVGVGGAIQGNVCRFKEQLGGILP